MSTGGTEPSWLHTVWGRFAGAIDRGRLAHALLLHGPRGVGKRQLGDWLAGALLCVSPLPDRRSCGECRGCRLRRAGSHPDHWRLEPEKEGGGLAIDRVRDLIAKVNLTPQLAAVKVALIVPAEALNRAASNALLKTLEEPPGSAVFILVSDAPARISSTIRSRCQAVAVSAPSPELAREWLADEPRAADLLALVDGAPVEARRLVEAGEDEAIRAIRRDLAELAVGRVDPLSVARQLRERAPCHRIVDTLQGLLAALVRLKFGLPAPLTSEEREILTPIAERLEFAQLFGLADRAMDARRSLEAGIALSEQLVVDDLAIAWSRGVGSES